MLIIPAVDIQNGCVVRLVQGKFARKVYSRDPLKAAVHWVKQRAELLHVVDLDGAIGGKPKNLDVIKQIARSIDIPIEVGGGIRDIKTIKDLLSAGVLRVVLGTRAIEDNAFLVEAYQAFKEKIIVSVDVKDGLIQTKGWQSSYRESNVVDYILKLKKLGLKEIIYTDTLKDGTLKGPNILGIKRILLKTSIQLIASGGVSSLRDIHRLKELESLGVKGVIIGKALYEGKFTFRQALKMR